MLLLVIFSNNCFSLSKLKIFLAPTTKFHKQYVSKNFFKKEKLWKDIIFMLKVTVGKSILLKCSITKLKLELKLKF